MICPICGTYNMTIGSCRAQATDDCNIKVHFAICNGEIENCPSYGNEICELNIIRESNLLIQEAIDKLRCEKQIQLTPRDLLRRIDKLDKTIDRTQIILKENDP